MPSFAIPGASSSKSARWAGPVCSSKGRRAGCSSIAGQSLAFPTIASRDDPFPREQFQLYEFDKPGTPLNASVSWTPSSTTWANFFDCIRAGKMPISDYESQHRSATTCHLINLAIRLGRPLKWDADKEQFIGDADANNWLAREQRKGFEVA